MASRRSQETGDMRKQTGEDLLASITARRTEMRMRRSQSYDLRVHSAHDHENSPPGSPPGSPKVVKKDLSFDRQVTTMSDDGSAATKTRHSMRESHNVGLHMRLEERAEQRSRDTASAQRQRAERATRIRERIAAREAQHFERLHGGSDDITRGQSHLSLSSGGSSASHPMGAIATDSSTESPSASYQAGACNPTVPASNFDPSGRQDVPDGGAPAPAKPKTEGLRPVITETNLFNPLAHNVGVTWMKAKPSGSQGGASSREDE